MSMRRSKKILEDIHPLNVIKEVQKWPVLYQKDNPERLNYHFKTKVWYEVAKNLIPEWDQLSDSEKEIKVSELNKKWRNLRDTFRRHVEAERKARSSTSPAPNPPKRRYVYFKHMLFLLPHVASQDDEEVPDEPAVQRYLTKRHRDRDHDTDKRKHKRKVQDNLSGESKSEHIDEDRHFLMSLIPSFKKMSDHEKLTAKVEILKVIQQVRSTTTSIEFTSPDIAYVDECGDGDASTAGVKVELLPEGEDLDSDQSVDSDSQELS